MNKQELIRRFKNYNKKYCWQYHIRLENKDKDLSEIKMAEEDLKNLKIKDFRFQVLSKENKDEFEKAVEFIKRHEWLGSMPQRHTHIFLAYYKEFLAGVIVMSTPNAFSKLIGEETKNLEKLISRGACVSWSPKNLASWLIKNSINWMIKNTEYRIFSAYSDPEAYELGIIYQSCNFIYLGQKSGGKFQLYDKNNPDKGYFSDREIRKISSFKRYAKKINIRWEKEWNDKGKINWDKIPKDIVLLLRQESHNYLNECEKIFLKPKHKYVFIGGRNKRERNFYFKKFLLFNPKLNYKLDCGRLIGKKYPKEKNRGL